MYNVTISIDDLHPEKGWGCDGDLSVAYLKNLWEEFGCKFTLFVPSNYHGKYPLSKHKDWVDFWLNQEWVELAAHGHFHQCEREGIGECEFFELDTEDKALERIGASLSEWESVGYKPKGWRNPGWLINPSIKDVVDNEFDYVALHTEHNHDLKWKSKMLFGHDGINETDSINIWNENTFMFQSHIAGDWNDNCWTEENYLNFRNVIEYLSTQYELSFKTLREL